MLNTFLRSEKFNTLLQNYCQIKRRTTTPHPTPAPKNLFPWYLASLQQEFTQISQEDHRSTSITRLYSKARGSLFYLWPQLKELFKG